MGSNVIFRFSFRSSLFIVYQYYTGCWFYFSYFLLYVFLSTHLQVQNHAEVIGEFLQRRVNFIVSALGSINPSEFNKASETIDISTEVVPYRLDNLEDKVNVAVKAVSGGVWSQRHGVMFAGNIDRIEEEIAEIKEEQAAKNEQIGNKEQKNAS